MGMYTQYRGFICVDSINQHPMKKVEEYFNKVLFDWKEAQGRRTWLTKAVWLHEGPNGSKWIFIGTEHTDYDDSVRSLIETIVAAFPGCEGRIEKQYEETKCYQGMDTVFIISNGIISEEKYTPHQNGYGLDVKMGVE